jgi:hypothetical protein
MRTAKAGFPGSFLPGFLFIWKKIPKVSQFIKYFYLKYAAE